MPRAESWRFWNVLNTIVFPIHASFLKLYPHIPGSQCILQIRHIGDGADRRVAVGRGKRLIKHHDATVPIQHHVPRMDGPYGNRFFGKRPRKVMVLFIPIQFFHFGFKRETVSQRLNCGVVGKFDGEDLLPHHEAHG